MMHQGQETSEIISIEIVFFMLEVLYKIQQ